MAATIGPNMMVDPPSPDCLDHGAALHFRGSLATNDMASQHALAAHPQASPRSNPPPPNPPFVFPARPSSSSALSSLSRATGIRPRSAIEPNSTASNVDLGDEQPLPRSPALPAFSFNPGASLPPASDVDNMFLSPPQSPSAPSSPRSAPARPAGHGHRRGGSEFVGGNIRDGEAITVTNASPTKSDSGMSSPLLEPTRTRRGHAHRRSAAISSHDLSSVMVPPAGHNVGGTSAPGTPAVTHSPARQDFVGADKPAETKGPCPLSVTESRLARAADASPAVRQPEQSPKPVGRNRVGFSDRLEYIPRPLSLVSTDTTSTVTVRPGHSVSGSISSVISVANADREANVPSVAAPNPKLSDSRPSTAGAILERTQSAQGQDRALRSPRRRGSIPFLGSLPQSIPLSPAMPSPARSTKKWSFFGLDPFISGSPTRAHPDSPRSSNWPSTSTERSSMEQISNAVIQGLREMSNVPTIASKKRNKKPKKVKTWAGSILSRKGRHRYGKQKRRTPTPPPLRHSDVDDGVMDMSLEPEPAVPSFTVTHSASGYNGREGWPFPKPVSVPDEDASYPMIDLDAALGPFNTPLPRNPEWEAAQRAGGHVKKQLHSAAGMSRFSGPGMHYYHRRAESAPELVPFEGGPLGFRHCGSSSTMADVFEEDEEEEEEDSAGSSAGQSTPPAEVSAAMQPESLSVSEEEQSPKMLCQHCVEPDKPASLAEASQPEPCGAEVPARNPESVLEQPANSGCDDASLGEPAPGYLVGSQASSPSRANSGSETPSPRHVVRPKDLAPVELSPLNLPTASLGPISPWSMTQSSAFPSPRSAMSYDAHCISTAPSSITEDTFQSLLMGEPGPEVRISVDDIPSLTSSNSTTTRDSFFGQHPHARQSPLQDLPRPASFTSTAFGRRRSSLASLSRLVSSSHGERSKLSIEVPMGSEPEKKAKTSKTKRLSRMMQFWRSKESNKG